MNPDQQPDEQIDELLKDLDTALSVDPSPNVAARVRERIATEPAGSWWQRSFVGQTFRSAFLTHEGLGYLRAVLTAVFVVVLGAAAYYQSRYANAPAPQVATHVDPPKTTTAPPHVVQPRPALPAAPIVRTARAGGVRVPSVQKDREPEVIISPGTRLALAQLDAALKAGTLTEASFAAAPVSTEPEVITVTPLEIDVVKIPLPPGQPGGGTVR